MEEHEHRCWVCLDDEAAGSAGWIAPCACVGTNKWVHEECLKSYCLQHLAQNPSPSLHVACPICKAVYRITPRAERPGLLGWRELVQFTSTDRQLLLRHFRFFFLVVPLLGSTILGWVWLTRYWDDVYRNGFGPMLREAGADPTDDEYGPPRHAFSWVPNLLRDVIEYVGVRGALPPAAPLLPNEMGSHAPFEPALHPAAITKQWSMLYVWLQYTQWCTRARGRCVSVEAAAPHPLPDTRPSAPRQVQGPLLAAGHGSRRIGGAAATRRARGLPHRGASACERPTRAGGRRPRHPQPVPFSSLLLPYELTRGYE